MTTPTDDFERERDAPTDDLLNGAEVHEAGVRIQLEIDQNINLAHDQINVPIVKISESSTTPVLNSGIWISVWIGSNSLLLRYIVLPTQFLSKNMNLGQAIYRARVFPQLLNLLPRISKPRLQTPETLKPLPDRHPCSRMHADAEDFRSVW